MTKSAVSHQLRILKQSRLVKARKQRKVRYYSLNDNHIGQIFNCGLNHIKEIYNVRGDKMSTEVLVKKDLILVV